MVRRVTVLASFVVLAFPSVIYAQAEGPAEVPAASYLGQSYVDSKGCIFLKAGYGGDATWVARVGQDRKPVCGQSPTNAVAKITDGAASGGAAPSKTRAKRSKVAAVAPQATVMIGCPVSVPVARRYATTDGGSVVVCTATNGSLTGARSPIYPAGSGVGAALSKLRYPGAVIALPEGRAAAAQMTQAPALSPAGAVANKAGYLVQVGAFAQPANAQGATERLAAMGLPVSKSKFSKKGQALQVVYAGPFGSGAEAQSALAALRLNGFSDAYIR